MIRHLLDRSYDVTRAYWPFFLGVIVLVALLMRVHWGFRVLAFALLAIVAVITVTGAAVALYDLSTGGVREPKFLLRLAARSEQARERIRRLTAERTDIRQRIDQLRQFGASGEREGTEVSGKQWGKSLALLEGYEREFELRSAKLEFYRQSLRSLTELEEKWRQERRLNELQRDLERLRKPNEQETERMRTLRAELAYEDKLLTTYRDLSKRIDQADDLTQARGVREDLDRLLS